MVNGRPNRFIEYAARLKSSAARSTAPGMSAAMAALLPDAGLEPLGDQALEDIDHPQAVFGLKGTMSS